MIRKDIDVTKKNIQTLVALEIMFHSSLFLRRTARTDEAQQHIQHINCY